ncbi:LysR family transcriptional regulator [Sphingomonas sp. R-74633]|uniref:helix-turn-helix domain-containing protein n=1 Tax=Sphingomonas sp. R-74633 TaxID=2751188 RepID=UPI0015D36704|nr:LysR family transcriptional regulator [Sphingomonas sp. R-74633]NYT40778.1 LysR family transcriptional regulator [Sphingomonas sp. R-74633]
MKKETKLVPFRLAWVQTFLAVRNEGSFSAAARVIGCDQSSVSRSIDQLNTFLGGKLFDGHTPPKPTALGLAFEAKAVELMDWASACRKLKDLEAAPPQPARKGLRNRLWDLLAR